MPPGEHGGLRLYARANSDQRKAISVRGSWDLGRFLTGNQNSPSATVTIRHGGNFTINTTWNYRSITLPAGRIPHQPRQHARDL